MEALLALGEAGCGARRQATDDASHDRANGKGASDNRER